MRLAAAISVVLLSAGCASDGERVSAPVALPEVTPFSANQAGSALPPAWQPWTLLRNASRYELVRDGNDTVVRAVARNSASGLIHPLDIDPRAFPLLTWRWKLTDPPLVTKESPDDSPVRIVVSFDGDTSKLPFSERIFFANFRLFTGQDLPYAALMYIWGTQSPRETIMPSPRTTRVQMIVVERGRDGIGQWRDITRNVREDFRRAFGEEPGNIISIGIMTETDETARDVEAFYGNIFFRRANGSPAQ